MKKILTLAIALVMMMSLAVPAFAAGTPTTDLTIVDSSGFEGERSYVAYRLLEASVDSGTGNYAYQLNSKYTNVLAAELGIDPSTTPDVEKAIIDAIAAFTTSEAIRHFADSLYRAIIAAGLAADYPTSGTWNGSTVSVEQGYWLVADVTDLEAKDTNSDGVIDEFEQYSNSLVMIDTVGDTSVTVYNKPDVPVTDKKVDDENDSILDPVTGNEDAIAWEDTADHDIGDKVNFHIDGTLPNNISEYDYYKFLIVDTASAGLTYNVDSFAITVKGEPKVVKASGEAGADFWYDIVANADGSNTLYVYPAHGYTTHELDLTTPDPLDYVAKEANKENGGDFLKLFAAGTPHSQVNSATFNFTYTCTLNENAVVGAAGNPNEYELIFSNNPYTDSYGKTLPVVNIVFTFKTIFNKVDGSGQELEGADFAVYKFVGTFTAANATPAQQALIPTAVHLDALVDTAAAAASETLVYHPGANAYGIFVEVSKKATNAVADDPATPEDETKAATKFEFIGMDDGFYRLVETLVPVGYNGIDPIDFHLTASHDNEIKVGDAVLNSLQVVSKITGELVMTPDLTAGSLTATIENHSGSELPSTGGIGTTILYVCGSILVIAAVVVLVTKKRMSVKD